jgi:glycosyltransferase involved in cell wall biosynthesis
MDISIVIPAYNEVERIEPTLRDLHRFLTSERVSFEILVVDDGSSDGTALLVRALSRDLPGLSCLATSPNRGKGHAVRTGMRRARGKVRVMYDADASMPPEELPKLLKPVFAGNADIAIGSRYLDDSTTDAKQPAWRRWWSRLANQIVQRSLVAGICDTQCGFKAFSGFAADAIFSRTRINGWAFDLEALALAKRLGLSIEEVGVVWSDDERSRVSPLKDFFSVAREWYAIRGNLRRGAYGRLKLAR